MVLTIAQSEPSVVILRVSYVLFQLQETKAMFLKTYRKSTQLPNTGEGLDFLHTFEQLKCIRCGSEKHHTPFQNRVPHEQHFRFNFGQPLHDKRLREGGHDRITQKYQADNTVAICYRTPNT